MAERTAANVAVPQGGLVRAWIDPLLHPKFETFQRWDPRMGLRWRSISVVVSLIMAFIASLLVIAHDALSANYSLAGLSLTRFSGYLLSPHGKFQLFCFWFGSIVVVYVMPGAVAAIGQRLIGPYRIRYHVAFGTFAQVLPVACLFLFLAALAYLFAGFFDASSPVVYIVIRVFIFTSLTFGSGLGDEALAASSGRHRIVVRPVTIVVYILICLLLWNLVGSILTSLGYPVL